MYSRDRSGGVWCLAEIGRAHGHGVEHMFGMIDRHSVCRVMHSDRFVHSNAVNVFTHPLTSFEGFTQHGMRNCAHVGTVHGGREWRWHWLEMTHGAIGMACCPMEAV